jgi:hypothetical protein
MRWMLSELVAGLLYLPRHIFLEPVCMYLEIFTALRFVSLLRNQSENRESEVTTCWVL